MTLSRLLRPLNSRDVRVDSPQRRHHGRRRLLAGIAVLAATAMTFVASPASAAAGCAESSVNVVAHPDDDLFFMNPDVLRTIASGGCSATVYVTSGDAGGEDAYYVGRETGVKAAYAQMAGVASEWTTARVTFAGRSVTRATLTARPTVQLYFLRLPDGYVDGAGSARSDHRSLEQLELGTADALETLDVPVQRYTRDQVVATLGAIIAASAPSAVRTLDEEGEYGDGDHSDHHAVGRLVAEAHAAAAPSARFAGYLGYTTTALPENVEGSDLEAKMAAFFAYAPHDPGSCLSAEECAYGSSGDWLVRQHVNTDTPDEPSIPTGTNVAGTATVTASSQNAETGQIATKAVDGVVDGYPGDHTAEWASAGEGAGAWLQLGWASEVELNGVVLYDRPNEYDQVTGATLTFSDGSTVAVPSLDDDGGAVTVTFPARSTSSLRIGVTAVSGTTSNVGIAELQAWGTVPPVEEPAVPSGADVAGSATVTASSENTWDGQTATKAVDGVVDGYPGDHTAEWASAGERAGAWLQLDWASAVELNAVVLHDRPNEYDQVTAATLTFSDGSTVNVPSLDNAGGAVTVTFPVRTATWMRITVTSVSAYTSNVGLAEVDAWSTSTVVTPPPTEPEPTEPTPAEPTPAEPTPTEPTPTEPEPAEPTPTEPEPALPSGADVAGSATVTASSENTWDGQTATKAVDGVVDGYPGDHTAEWASAGEGAGAWLQLGWASEVELNGVVLYDRPNEYDQVTGATLTFSDGSTVAVPALENAGGAVTVTFPARSTTSLRITVTSVGTWTGNVGLAEVEAWGAEPAVTASPTTATSSSAPTGDPAAGAAGAAESPVPEAAPSGPATAPLDGPPVEPAPATADQPDARLDETEAAVTD
ncbi:DUF7402 domain-containing protein [Geodermatophilus sp. SYSU D00079]